MSRLGRADLVEGIRQRIVASVNGDLSRRDWFRDVTAMMKEAGWWGEKQVQTPDGRIVTTRFNPRRLKLIYEVNTRMAYAAGRWERIQAAKETHPFLRYVTRADERVRESHRQWHNVTLPVDDPWWRAHYPPCGWRCRCRTVALRAKDVESRPELIRRAPDEPDVQWSNPLTGEVKDVPFAVDPGFDYNVGDASLRWQGLLRTATEKLDKLPADLSVAAIADLARSAVFARWLENPEGAWPLARLPDADAQAIGAANGARIAGLSAETMAKQVREHPELTAADYAQAQGVIAHYTNKVQDSPRTMVYVREVLDAGQDTAGWVLVVKTTQTGEGVFVTSLRRLSRDAAERDREVRRLLRRGGG